MEGVVGAAFELAITYGELHNEIDRWHSVFETIEGIEITAYMLQEDIGVLVEVNGELVLLANDFAPDEEIVFRKHYIPGEWEATIIALRAALRALAEEDIH